MLLRLPEELTYTVCARRASLTSSLNNQISKLPHDLTQLLPRALLEVTTMQSCLDFYVQSNTLPILTPIQLSGSPLSFTILSNLSAYRFQIKLQNNKVRVVAGDFSALLYPHDGFDPDDLESGLFRNPILLRVCITRCSFPIFKAHITH
jgi:hypothetical protein